MTSPAIDPARYAELQDTAGADFVVELVDTFLEEAPGMLAELRERTRRRRCRSLSARCALAQVEQPHLRRARRSARSRASWN